jgi:hypothetical protein
MIKLQLLLIPQEMAMTCVFVASKMEETVKKTRDVALATLKAVHEDDEGLLQDIDGTV